MIQKMIKKPKLLDKRDLETKFSAIENYNFASEVGAIAVSFRETAEASKYYPIMFIKESDGFSAIAILGADKDKNLFIDKNGKWLTRYIPSMIRLYPFAFSKASADAKTISIAYDTESKLVNAKKGETFFKDDQTLSVYGEKIKNGAEELYNDISVLKNITKELERLQLLTPIDISFGKKDKAQHRITGIYQVDPEKLNKLSDTEVLNLTKIGGMNLINNHLNSLSNFDELVNKLD
ncbi:SapC [Thiovulum sp. ES]|nr:SapC [Thiovulum sp. ES]